MIKCVFRLSIISRLRISCVDRSFALIFLTPFPVPSIGGAMSGGGGILSLFCFFMENLFLFKIFIHLRISNQNIKAE